MGKYDNEIEQIKQSIWADTYQGRMWILQLSLLNLGDALLRLPIWYWIVLVGGTIAICVIWR